MSSTQATSGTQTGLPSDVIEYIRNISTNIETDLYEEKTGQYMEKACRELLDGTGITLTIEDIKCIRPKIVVEFIEMLPTDKSLGLNLSLTDKREPTLRSVVTATMVNEDTEETTTLYLDECLVFIYIVNHYKFTM